MIQYQSEVEARAEAQRCGSARLDAAGTALAEVAARLLGEVAGRFIVVVAGPGLTGAAGIAGARALHAAGAAVRLVLARLPGTLHGPAEAQAARAEGEGLRPWSLALPTEALDEHEPIEWTEADLLVDALLGSGIAGDPKAEVADLIQLMNSSGRPILALDVPSGLVEDEGWILSPCVDATATLALDMPRHAHREGWPVVGRLFIADLDHGTVREAESK